MNSFFGHHIHWLAIGTGICFGSWPLLIRVLGLGPLVPLIIPISTLLVGVMYLYVEVPRMSAMSFVIGLVIGILNGFAMLGLSKILSMHSTVMSEDTVVVFITMVIVLAVGGVLLLTEPVTVKKALFLTGIMVCLYGLAR